MASGPRYYTPLAYAFDSTGVTVPGALLNFYLTGSSTRTPTFSNQALTVANANPVVADAGGVFPPIFLNSTVSYKVVYTGPNDGITTPHEYWTADPVTEAWPSANDIFFDAPFEFLGLPPSANDILGLYVAVRPQRIFGDFDGTGGGFEKAWGICLTPPADGNVTITVSLGATLVGHIVVAQTTGAFTFSTVAGAPIDMDDGNYLIFQMQGVADSVFANFGWTITGINL